MAILLLQYCVICTSHPVHNIHFEDHDEFVIAADISISEDELEMLNEGDTRALNLDFDEAKLGPLYKKLRRSRNTGSREQNPEEEFLGMKGSDTLRRTPGSYLKRDVKAPDDIAQDPHADKLPQKRSSKEETAQYDEGPLEATLKSNSTEQTEDYDYESLRNDYYHEVQGALHSNTSLNDTAGNRFEESFDFRTPEHKDKEESSNSAIKFITWLFGVGSWRMHMGTIPTVEAILMVASLCLLVCLICWCRHGICCCCCFRCSCCWPRRLINKAKKYVAINPPGVAYENGKEIRYEPTEYETEAYSELRKAVLSL